MKEIKKVAFGIVIFLIFFIQAHAHSNLTLDVKVGFEGRCKLGGLNPVGIAMVSEDKDIEGNLVLEMDDRVYKSFISLPKGTKKTIEFSIPIFKGNNPIKVYFMSGEDIVSSKNITPEIISSSSLAIGLVSETPEELYYVRGIKPFFLKNRQVVAIKLDEKLSYSLEELENINVMVIDNFNIGNLSKENQDILLEWISRGGLALVGTGEFGHKTLTGVFSHINGVERLGDGGVVGLSTNLLKEKDAKLIQASIEKYISPRGLEAIIQESHLDNKAQASEELQFVADHLLKPRVDKLLLLSILLLIYIILIIGTLLWKERPRGTASIVILGVSSLFYIMAWAGGLQSTKAVCSSIILHKEAATSFSLTNIYPYKGDVMGVDISKADFAKEMTNENYILDPIKEEIIYNDINAHYLFIKERDSGDKSKLTLELSEDIVGGELTNPLPHGLYNAFLIIGDTIVPLGNIKSKEKVNIEYQLDHRLFNLSDYNYIANISQTAGLDTYKREIFEYYLSHIKTKGINCKLVGFSKNERRISINGKNKKIKNLSLNICPINMKAKGTEISLPPKFIEPICEHNKELSKNLQNEYSLEKGGELLLYYVIPSSLKPSNISIFTNIEGGEVKLQLYNHNKHMWESLNTGMLEGDRLMNYTQDRPLALKVTGEGRLIIPQISIKGKINPGDELYE